MRNMIKNMGVEKNTKSPYASEKQEERQYNSMYTFRRKVVRRTGGIFLTKITNTGMKKSTKYSYEEKAATIQCRICSLEFGNYKKLWTAKRQRLDSFVYTLPNVKRLG